MYDTRIIKVTIIKKKFTMQDSADRKISISILASDKTQFKAKD
jgi:hypothetical protein